MNKKLKLLHSPFMKGRGALFTSDEGLTIDQGKFHNKVCLLVETCLSPPHLLKSSSYRL